MHEFESPAKAHRHYHLRSAILSRTNLSRINEDKFYTLYEAKFIWLSTREMKNHSY